MLIPKLALRNLLGAGLRTWLNVVVLSFAFIAIITAQGLLEGMNEQAAQAMKDTQYGSGQYWQTKYDPYDPLTLQDAHAVVPEQLNSLIKEGKATALLIIQGTIYPDGRIRPVLIKGIDPGQKILTLPSEYLIDNNGEIPALIGTRMAGSTGLKVGDYVTLQWRDANGTFDAKDIRIAQVMKTTVQSIDVGQIWIPLNTLQEMAGMPNEATLVTLGKDVRFDAETEGWLFKDLNFLLKDIRELIESKTLGSMIVYVILLFLAMLAIFDTQVLSIFRRRKEMGTMMAMGMTRGRVIQLFTTEGALHGVLAAVLAALYGLPLLTYFAKIGWTLPSNTDSYGFAIGETLFPSFSAALVLGTTILVLLVTTIVSFLPTRKIAKLKPTDALRGKLT